MRVDDTVRQTDTLYKACKTMFVTLESQEVMLRAVSMQAVVRATLGMADCAGLVALCEHAEERLPALWDSYMKMSGRSVNREARLSHVDTLYTELAKMLAPPEEPPEKVDVIHVEFYLLYEGQTWDSRVIYVKEEESNSRWTCDDWTGWLWNYYYAGVERIVVVDTTTAEVERHEVWNGA